ncbi:hypothetical protein KP78_02150 [Jeotgalibacillus soli]|uniref:Uncharacterized protein n=1 Tax=Jeotgalibacillus soli TaxID=889306 RepID=A0A0C2RNJ0_9BACL|nr:hypothetical protein KP78_02150 [Jeotgalibacillus soli]
MEEYASDQVWGCKEIVIDGAELFGRYFPENNCRRDGEVFNL